MADVITRFKLETTQFDSKLRDEAVRLAELTKKLTYAGKDFDKFAKDHVKVAQALGKVESGATNLKDKLKDLVGAYNQAARAYNHLTDEQKSGDFGKAFAQSLQKLQRDITKTKNEIYGLGDAMKGGGASVSGGGLSDAMSGLTSKFFKGNIYAMAAEKGLEALQAIGEHVVDVTKKANELAIASEGVRNAFNRLDRPDLLKQLREATHGTVSDFELMKQAVKFNDFKLPLQDLGTYLAFAQQKAKDTGQSVDYMVDSIVTGLGRKSKQILDNLGISAAELTKRMNEGKDMTAAVAEIIREEMEKAGDYVETASDRMAQSAANVENAMLELGINMQRTFDGINIDVVTNQLEYGLVVGLNDSIRTLEDLKSVLSAVGIEGLDAMQGIANASRTLVHETLLLIAPLYEVYNLYKMIAGDGKVRLDHTPGGHILTRNGLTTTTTTTTTPKGGRGGKVDPVYDPTSIAYQQKVVQELTKAYNEASAAERDYKKQLMEEAKLKLDIMTGRTQVRDMIGTVEPGRQGISEIKTEDIVGALVREIKLRPFEQAKDYSNNPFIKKDKDGKTTAKMSETFGAISGGISDIAGTMEQMGIELPQELKGVLGGINSVITILTTISTIISAIEALTAADTIIPFARGGVVHAAFGYQVPGNHYSGDMVPALLNSGETVLNKAQAGVISNALQSSGFGGRLVARLKGRDLLLSIDRELAATGKGQLLTFR